MSVHRNSCTLNCLIPWKKLKVFAKVEEGDTGEMSRTIPGTLDDV